MTTTTTDKEKVGDIPTKEVICFWCHKPLMVREDLEISGEEGKKRWYHRQCMDIMWKVTFGSAGICDIKREEG